MTLPKVLIVGLAKDAEDWLPRNLKQIDMLDYPKELLSYSYVEGNSKDNTIQLLADWLVTKNKFTLTKCNIQHTDERVRTWMSTRVAWKALDDEDYVFMCDSDVVGLPPETLRVLISKDVDIVAPYIYVDDSYLEHPNPDGPQLFYDSWAFRFDGVMWDNSSKTAVKMIDAADPNTGLIPMNSVGANPILLKSDVVREVWYSGPADIVGFCIQALKYGFKIWSYPALRCVHAWESI